MMMNVSMTDADIQDLAAIAKDNEDALPSREMILILPQARISLKSRLKERTQSHLP